MELAVVLAVRGRTVGAVIGLVVVLVILLSRLVRSRQRLHFLIALDNAWAECRRCSAMRHNRAVRAGLVVLALGVTVSSLLRAMPSAALDVGVLVVWGGGLALMYAEDPAVFHRSLRAKDVLGALAPLVLGLVLIAAVVRASR